MFQQSNSIRRRMKLLPAVLCLLAVLPFLPLRAAAVQEDPALNLLLIGQDRLEGEERARSDSIILCTFHPKAHTLTMTSFLRDLYLPIPGWGSNRINAAYTFGGIPLLRQTIEENFDITLDGCIEVDFTQFSQIIDELGGVDLELRADEAAHIGQETGSRLSEGLQHLDGAQTLSYARIRRLDADGDFSRTQRQRTVLSQLLERYRSANFVTVAKLLGKILPMVTTDMTAKEILSHAITLFPMLSDASATTQRIPADGTYEDRTIEGMNVLVADLNKARQFLAETLAPD